MSRELQADSGVGADDALSTPDTGAVPLIVAGLLDTAEDAVVADAAATDDVVTDAAAVDDAVADVVAAGAVVAEAVAADAPIVDAPIVDATIVDAAVAEVVTADDAVTDAAAVDDAVVNAALVVAADAAVVDAAGADTGRDERLLQLGAMVLAIAHDLRQHISVVGGVAELTRDAELRQERVTIETAAMLQRAFDGMMRMTQDILQYARGVPSVTLRDEPVRALVTELDEVALRKLERRGIRVDRHVHFEGNVFCDRDLLVRALINLINNAGDAMPQGGRLTLTVEACEGSVVIGIQDTGSGIPADTLPTIFEPFVTHKRSGNGLGLAIVRDIVVGAHGGSIGVSSTVGRGTTFVVTLPRQCEGDGVLEQPPPAKEQPLAA